MGTKEVLVASGHVGEQSLGKTNREEGSQLLFQCRLISTSLVQLLIKYEGTPCSHPKVKPLPFSLESVHSLGF